MSTGLSCLFASAYYCVLWALVLKECWICAFPHISYHRGATTRFERGGGLDLAQWVNAEIVFTVVVARNNGELNHKSYRNGNLRRNFQVAIFPSRVLFICGVRAVLVSKDPTLLRLHFSHRQICWANINSSGGRQAVELLMLLPRDSHCHVIVGLGLDGHCYSAIGCAELWSVCQGTKSRKQLRWSSDSGNAKRFHYYPLQQTECKVRSSWRRRRNEAIQEDNVEKEKCNGKQ